MSFKQRVHNRFVQIVNDRIDVFRDMISALSEDSQNDAKSSAGDKHETALSMMHLEQEKLNRKLAEVYAQKSVLDKIDPSSTSEKIALGSLVNTNGMLLYISAALPKITVDDQTVIAVSPQSPLGAKLMGNSPGFKFQIGNSDYQVSQVQ